MKKVIEIALGVVTSVGGFLEMGELSTTAQAGAGFGFQMGWALLLGTVCIIFLTEMAGRFAAVSHHSIIDGMRDRFGVKFFLWPLVTTMLVSLLVLAAELGGVSAALELATGISYRWWAPVAALLTWLLLWRGTFGMVEKGVAILGLVTVTFVAAAVVLKPEWRAVGAGLVPGAAHHDAATYWFLVASILGASISPSLFLFYSAGAIEDKWDDSYLGANRVIATLGMTFGGVISLGVLVVAAMVLHRAGVEQVQDFRQLPLLLVPVFGIAGFWLFAASLAIASFGAALEVALQQAYLIAQGFGWNWGENCPPRDNPGFSLAYSIAIIVSAVPLAAGVDPLKLTIVSMALTAVSLPFMVFPFLVLMNDEHYLGKRRNGPISNVAVSAIIVLGFVLAVVTLPLQLFGGT